MNSNESLPVENQSEKPLATRPVWWKRKTTFIASALAFIVVIATVALGGYSYAQTRKAHAQWEEAKTQHTQQVETLQNTTSQAREVLELIDEHAPELSARSPLEAAIGEADDASEEPNMGQVSESSRKQIQANTADLRDLTTKIADITAKLETTSNDARQELATLASEKFEKAREDLNAAITAAQKANQKGVGAKDKKTLANALKDAKAIKTSSAKPGENLQQLKTTFDTIKRLHKQKTDLNKATNIVAQAHKQWAQAQAAKKAQTPPAPQPPVVGQGWAGQNNPGTQWSGGNTWNNPTPPPASPPRPAPPADDGSYWVESLEPGPDECWLGDTSGRPAVRVPCDP